MGRMEPPSTKQSALKSFYTPFSIGLSCLCHSQWPTQIKNQHSDFNVSEHFGLKRPKKERRKVCAITGLVYSSSRCLQRYANRQI